MVTVFVVNQKTGNKKLYRYSYGNFNVIAYKVAQSSKKSPTKTFLIKENNKQTLYYQGKVVA